MSAPRGGPLPDAVDRSLAATVFDRNLVVTAGAGTGKTALLVERALNLIASGRATIRTLAAITFTEKAAAELRQRLAAGLDALQRLAGPGGDPAAADLRTESGRAYRWLAGDQGIPAADIHVRAREALTDLDAASISTIHAFCSELLRRFPDRAGVDPAFGVDEGPAFELTFEEEWGRFLLDETGPSPSRGDLWRKVLGLPGALGDIRTVGRAMALLGMTADRASGAGSRRAMDLLMELASIARARIMEILGTTSGRNERMTTWLSGAAQLLESFSEGGTAGMAAVTTPLTLEDLLGFKSLPSPGSKIQGATQEEVRHVAKEAETLIKILARLDEERVRAIVGAAGPLADRARARYLAAGYVSFDALLQISRDLLHGSPAIRKSLGARFETILVDEFQDTDPLQYEILFYLTEDAEEPSDDAWAARLAPGRLFIVGDPKQSIYRFRGADMEAYRRAVDRVLACGGEELSLSASFRSPAGIVDPVNRLFGAWMAPATEEGLRYEAPYGPIDSAVESPPASEGPLVEIWSMDAGGLAAEGRHAEAGEIARWISEHRGDDAGDGPLRLNHVAILLRALTNAGIYAQALRRAGLPYVVEGGRGFYERPEVGDLLAFLGAALNRRDGAAVLAVMRSPLGGVDDAELARFAAAGGRLDGTALPGDPGAFPGVTRVFELLKEFRSEMQGRSVAEIVDRALHGTGLLLLHAAAHEGAQRVANLEKIAARAGDVARRGLSLEETLSFIESEYRGEVAQGEAPLADETVDAVRILSIHKAKGLEYPVVFVPDLGRRENHGGGNEAGAILVQHAGERLLGVRLSTGALDAAMAWHSIASRLHDAAEEKRVFYVACTRARGRLVLVNSQSGRGAHPWRNALAAIGYDAEAGMPPSGALCDGLVRHRRIDPAPYEAASRDDVADPGWRRAAEEFGRIRERAEALAIAPQMRPSGAGDARVAVPGPQEEDAPATRGGRERQDVARRAGSAVHAALEKWDFADGEALIERGRDAAARQIGGEEVAGDDPDLQARVAGETEEILRGFLASALPAKLRGLLSGGDRIGRGLRELPLLLAAEPGEGGAFWAGACDLVYRDADGTLVVADYKTGPAGDDPAAAAGKYLPQLAVYARALLRALPGERVRAEVIFVRSGECVPLNVEGD